MRAATFLGAVILTALTASACGRGTQPSSQPSAAAAGSATAAPAPAGPTPKRLTLNYGSRFDYAASHYPDVHLTATNILPDRGTIPSTDIFGSIR